MPHTYSYTCFGLRFISEVKVPEFALYDGGSHDVTIRVNASVGIGSAREATNGASLPCPVRKENEKQTIVSSPGIGFYRIDKNVIDCFPEQGISDEILRLPLLGVVPSVLCMIRGYIALHASAVSINGKAVGFLGNKGHGKSTLTAHLVKRGYPLVTDDALVIRKTREGAWKAVRGPRGIKLWPDVVDEIGCETDYLYSLYTGSTRQVWSPPNTLSEQDLSLESLYILTFGKISKVSRIGGHELLFSIMSNDISYRVMRGRQKSWISASLIKQLCENIDVYKIQRRKDIEEIDKTVRYIIGE